MSNRKLIKKAVVVAKSMSFYKPEKLPKLMVAPNGARKVKKDHPAVPLTISETVETSKSCYIAGAGAIHLHVRDNE